MANIPSKYQEWIALLLSDEPAKVQQALRALPDNLPPEKALHALAIVWQLHDKESLQDQAEVLLRQFRDGSELSTIKKHFVVFQSIAEVFPWSEGDTTALQQVNLEQFRAASELYLELLVQYTDYRELLLDLGRKLYMLFYLEEEARFCFESILRFNSEQDEALYALGRIEEKKHEYEEALSYYNQSIAANPDNNYAQLQAGILKLTIFQQYEKSIDHFNKVIEKDPYAAEPYVKVAEACFKMEDYERSKQFIDIALGINEFHEEALNLLGTLQWKVEEDYEKAIATYEKGLDHVMHGDSALLLASLGDLYVHYQQDYDRARLYYEKSLKVNPAQKQVLEEFVPILIDVFQDYAAVEQLYENFLTVDKADPDIYTAYARFLVDYLHHYELAFEKLQMALEINDELDVALKLINRIEEYVEAVDDPTVFDAENEGDDFEDDDDDDDDDDFSGGSAAGDN